MNLSFKETGRLTFGQFKKLYGHYKDVWDMEMIMTRKGKTYDQVYKEAREIEDIF